MSFWDYDNWPSGEPYEWMMGGRGHRDDDQMDFHVDLGCGKIKKGRIGVDRYPAPGVNVVADLDAADLYAVAPAPGRDAVDPLPAGASRWYTGGERTARLALATDADSFDYPPGSEFLRLPNRWGCVLPFEDNSIESMISHHALEHIGNGFLPLMDDVYRALKPGAPFRVIVPLFPSRTAVEDPDHKRWFMDGTFDALCGTPDNCWCESFSVPYTKARFEVTDRDVSPPTPPEKQWGPEDAREMRITLRAVK